MGKRQDRVARAVLASAVLLLLTGLATAGTVAWTWWGRTREINAAQQRLSRQWPAGVAQPAAAVPRMAGPGRAAVAAPAPVTMPFGALAEEPHSGPAVPLARLHLPTLGIDLVVVDGADDAALRLGPGHIPGTAPIGAAGNTGIAGARYPGVFWALNRLRVGDPVVLETGDTWLVYRVVEARVVRPEEAGVLGPPPPGSSPLLTLVTCEPRLSTARRLIRQATLVRRDPHAGPRPAELA
ncbi:class E sortase [Dactylosporangium sp. NPDC051485]|uniref:sortase n=1 Tax=Dactylosporangium sp. NPDC051485 TaxID=3154846 RepID=UPI003446187A